MNREPDPAGLEYWVRRLERGEVTRAQIIESFFNSPEFQSTTAPIVRLYFAYFNRIPDYEGLMYYIDRQKQGMPLSAVSQGFAGSPEFITTYGSLDNAGFVDLVYRNVLGRAPDSEGRRYWIGRLNAGLTRGEMMIGFSESPEYIARSYPWVQVKMMLGMLRRAPEQEGFDYWVGQLNSGRSILDLINGFLWSNEYASRFK